MTVKAVALPTRQLWLQPTAFPSLCVCVHVRIYMCECGHACYNRQLEVRRQSQASVLAFTLLEMGFLTAGCQEGHTRWPINLGAFTGLHLLSHHRSAEIADELCFACLTWVMEVQTWVIMFTWQVLLTTESSP